jgi:hypothetical protein
MGVRLLAVSTVVTGSVLLALGLTLPFEQSRGRFLLALTKYLFKQLDISIALLHPYQLRRRLLELFREDGS